MRSSFPALLPILVIFMIIVSRRPLHMLRRRGATTPETAQRLDDLKPGDRRRLDSLIARGIIRETVPGTYYYDVAAERAQVQKKIPWLIALAVVLALVAVALAYFGNHQVKPLP